MLLSRVIKELACYLLKRRKISTFGRVFVCKSILIFQKSSTRTARGGSEVYLQCFETMKETILSVRLSRIVITRMFRRAPMSNTKISIGALLYFVVSAPYYRFIQKSEPTQYSRVAIQVLCRVLSILVLHDYVWTISNTPHVQT